MLLCGGTIVPYVRHLSFFVSKLFSSKSLEAEKNSTVRIMYFGQKLISVEQFQKLVTKMHLVTKWGKNRNVL